MKKLTMKAAHCSLSASGRKLIDSRIWMRVSDSTWMKGASSCLEHSVRWKWIVDQGGRGRQPTPLPVQSGRLHFLFSLLQGDWDHGRRLQRGPERDYRRERHDIVWAPVWCKHQQKRFPRMVWTKHHFESEEIRMVVEWQEPSMGEGRHTERKIKWRMAS